MKDLEPWDPSGPAWAGLLAFARRVLSGPAYDPAAADREDLAQEALLDLFERTRAEAPRNPEGLLRTIAHRKALDLFRSRKRWSLLVDGFDPARHDTPDAGPRPEDVLRLRVLDALPAIAEAWFREHNPDCLPHLKCYFEGGAWRDLAEEHDARVNTVIKQWGRCREEFARDLRGRGTAWMLGEGRGDG